MEKVKAGLYLSSKRGGPPFNFYMIEFGCKRAVNMFSKYSRSGGGEFSTRAPERS